MATLNGFSRSMAAGLLAHVALVGCSRMDEAALQTERRLRVISAAYLDFAAARGNGPANAAELRTHLANSAAAKFLSQELGGVDTATLFTSARDGAQFVLRFGVPIAISQGRAAPIMYEARGRDETRFIAFADGRVECVSADEIAPLTEFVAAQGGGRP